MKIFLLLDCEKKIINIKNYIIIALINKQTLIIAIDKLDKKSYLTT